MEKACEENMVNIPKLEYRILKEVYKTVKRQQFLVRLEEAEKSLKTGKIKKVSPDKFIESI
jgi:hypothetical protein